MATLYSNGYFGQIVEAFVGKGPDMALEAAARLAQAIAPAMLTALTLYLLALYVGYLRAGAAAAFADAALKIVLWLFLVALAFNADNYAIVAKTMMSLPDELSQSALGAKLDGSAMDASFNRIVTAMEGLRVATADLPAAEIADKMLVNLTVFAGYLTVCLTFVVILAYYILAKAQMLILAISGPVFLAFMAYPSTRSWGMNWAGHALSFAFLVLALNLVNRLYLNFYVNYCVGIVRAGFTPGMAVVVAPAVLSQLVIAFVIFALLIVNCSRLFQSLFSGAGVSLMAHSIHSVLRRSGKDED